MINGYGIDVGALVLGAVGAVGEGLAARRVLAQVRFLARMRTQVNLEVLQPRKGFRTPRVLPTFIFIIANVYLFISILTYQFMSPLISNIIQFTIQFSVIVNTN